MDRAEQQLTVLVRGDRWFMDVLAGARRGGAPDWWIGGGVLRDLVWDSRAGTFDPARVRDVDLAFFDPTDLSTGRDEQVERLLAAERPGVRWDAKNQAAVHTWYRRRFGFDVPPLHSAADGVATWPETATAVAVRLEDDGELRVTSVAGGVHDLLHGICRRNPRRVSHEEYRRRLLRKDVPGRWPYVVVHP